MTGNSLKFGAHRTDAPTPHPGGRSLHHHAASKSGIPKDDFVRQVATRLLSALSPGGPIVGIALVGSQAEGTADSTSDFDFFVLRQGPPSRGLKILEGKPVEWFVDSPDSVLNALGQEMAEAFRPTVHMWKAAKALYDPVGVVVYLASYARKIARKAPPPISEGERVAALATLQATIDDACREYTLSLTPSFECLVARTILNGLEFVYRVQGRQLPTPRNLNADLRRFVPGIAMSLERLNEARAGARFKAFRELADGLLSASGGPISEFDLDSVREEERSSRSHPQRPDRRRGNRRPGY